jgi:hypothetical protein
VPTNISHDRTGATRRTNRVFDALSNGGRRRIISRLSSADDPVAVRTLALDVAVAETGRPIDRIAPADYERAHAALVHAHLPKLQAADLVSVDGSTVALTADATSSPLSMLLATLAEETTQGEESGEQRR